MKLAVAATGTSSAARPLPQAAPDPNEEGGETILCGPCSSKHGEAQASGTNIIITSTKKDVVVVSVADGVDAEEYGASPIARKSDSDAMGDDDANCSDTSCTDSCTDDDSEAASVDDEWRALLEQVHELISERDNAKIEEMMVAVKQLVLLGKVKVNLQEKGETKDEQIAFLQKKIDTNGKAFAGRRDLTSRHLNTRLRELNKERKSLEGKIERQERMREEKSNDIQAISDQIGNRLKLMSSNSEEYWKLLERAYKAKRCAHCLTTASEKRDGVKTTKRCGGCKAVHYCGEKCQAANWDVHQHCCRNMKGRRDERIAKWYEKDRRHRDFEEKLNCGWYGEDSDVVGVPGSAGPFFNELLGFCGFTAVAKDGAYGCSAEDRVGDFCCMSGCVIA